MQMMIRSIRKLNSDVMIEDDTRREDLSAKVPDPILRSNTDYRLQYYRLHLRTNSILILNVLIIFSRPNSVDRLRLTLLSVTKRLVTCAIERLDLRLWLGNINM